MLLAEDAGFGGQGKCGSSALSPASCTSASSDLLDSADYAADTSGIDLERGAATGAYLDRRAAARPRSLGGKR